MSERTVTLMVTPQEAEDIWALVRVGIGLADFAGDDEKRERLGSLTYRLADAVPGGGWKEAK